MQWLVFGFVAFLTAPPLVSLLMSQSEGVLLNDSLGPLLITPFGHGFICFALGIQLKQQFANSRARMLPGFAMPHLIVGMLAFLTLHLWAMLPSVLVPEVSPLGFGAIVLHLGVLALWTGCSPRWSGVMALIVTFGIVPLLPVGRALLVEIAIGHEPILAMSIISAHVAMLVLLLNHLAGLSEDDPDYANVQPLEQWDMRATTLRDFDRQISARRSWLIDALAVGTSRKLERATATPASSSRQREILFGLGDNWPSPMLPNLILIGVFEVVMLLLGVRDAIRDVHGLQWAMVIPMLLSFVFAWGLWMPWMMRGPRLGYESLRAVSRVEWVMANGRSMATQIAMNQAAAITIQLLIVAVFLPKYLTASPLWAALIWFLGSQVLLFGLCALVASSGSALVLFLTFSLSLGAVVAPWFVSAVKRQLIDLPVSVGVSLGMAVLGVVCCKVAYRRWCCLDLA